MDVRYIAMYGQTVTRFGKTGHLCGCNSSSKFYYTRGCTRPPGAVNRVPGFGKAPRRTLTKTPVTPSFTIARFTPTSSVITGSPLAMASIRLFGNTSVREGKKKMSPLAYVSASRSPPAWPKICVRFANEKCQCCISRVLDDVWTTVRVIGPNSYQR